MVPNLTFAVATSEQLPRVLTFRDQVYREELGCAPTDSYDSKARHLIAVEPDDAIVAAFRMVGPEARPFEFEPYIPVGDLLRRSSTPAWIGRLCIAKSHRSLTSARGIHLCMLRLMLLVARRERYSHLLLYTGVHLMGFYRIAHFQTYREPFNHPVWGLQQLMFLNLKRIPRGRSSSSLLRRYLLGSPPGNFRL